MPTLSDTAHATDAVATTVHFGVRCVECGGPQLPQPDPRGWLGISHTGACGLGNHEDGRHYADWGRSWVDASWTRPPSATELTLLAGLGYDATRVTYTAVSMFPRALWGRRWPELEVAA